MQHNDPLLQILILLAASVCVVAGVRKLALPAILGYLAVGMLLGPHALALAADNDTTRLLADFGVVFLVFTLGLEFSLPRLVAMRWEVLGVGGAQVLVTTAIVAAGAITVLRHRARGRHRRRRRRGDVLDGDHHLAIDRAVGEQPHARPPRRGHLPVSGLELSVAARAACRRWPAPAGAAAEHIVAAIGIAAFALLLVLAAGRWLLRPLFLAIASVRSAELFSLAVLLAVLASAWATHAAGLSLALGAFLAGMMLAETEFRHQIEATIRSYREVLLGLFFITVGMLLDVRLLLRTLPLVTAILAGMLLLKTAVVAVVAKPATKSWFKSLRTGVVVAQGGEFGFALLTLLLRRELSDPAVVQPLLAATVLSMVLSPLLIRHNRRITRVLLGESGPPHTRGDARGAGHSGRRRARSRGDLRFRPRRAEHRARARTNRFRIHRARSRSLPHSGRPAGRRSGHLRRCRTDRSAGERRAWRMRAAWSSHSRTRKWRCGSCASVRELRADVPILVRTQDDTKLEELQTRRARPRWCRRPSRPASCCCPTCCCC